MGDDELLDQPRVQGHRVHLRVLLGAVSEIPCVRFCAQHINAADVDTLMSGFRSKPNVRSWRCLDLA